MGCAISGINNTKEVSPQAKNQYSSANAGPISVQKMAGNFIDLKKNHSISKSDGSRADTESSKDSPAQKSRDISLLSQPQPSYADPNND
jgi:hypothetical protein